jgi:type IV secretion system protein VirB6
LGVELALIEPRLAQLIAWRSAGYATPGAPVELLVISLVFALATMALLIAAWRVTAGFGLPASLRRARNQFVDAIGRREAIVPATLRPSISPSERSRAALIADALIVSQQREAAQGGTGYERAARRAEPHANNKEIGEQTGYRPLGQSYPRRARGRVSASGTRRDAGR